MPLSEKRVALLFLEKNGVNFFPFWLHKYRTNCSTQNLITLKKNSWQFYMFMVIFKKSANFNLAEIGILQKIRENDWVQICGLYSHSCKWRLWTNYPPYKPENGIKRKLTEFSFSQYHFENPSIFDRFIAKKLSF